MPSPNPNRLIVEGKDDLYSVAELMGAHVAWPEDKQFAPVHIQVAGSKDEILANGYLPAVLKDPGVRRVGVMLDADESPRGSYERIKQLLGHFLDLPPDLYSGGVTVQAEEIRFGVWVMPDNRSAGTLETFLAYLVPNEGRPLWEHAQSSVKSARKLGSGCRDAHVEKAELYTWLAWQDPPGDSPGLALTKKVLNPHSPQAALFVTWFRNLFAL